MRACTRSRLIHRLPGKSLPRFGSSARVAPGGRERRARDLANASALLAQGCFPASTGAALLAPGRGAGPRSVPGEARVRTDRDRKGRLAERPPRARETLLVPDVNAFPGHRLRRRLEVGDRRADPRGRSSAAFSTSTRPSSAASTPSIRRVLRARKDARSTYSLVGSDRVTGDWGTGRLGETRALHPVPTSPVPSPSYCRGSLPAKPSS
jgi:hypothetical protein